MGSFLRIPTLVNADEKANGAILQAAVKLKKSLKSDTYLNTFLFLSERFERKLGQSIRPARKLCLHSWTQRRQK
jgi:hypothetical protein